MRTSELRMLSQVIRGSNQNRTVIAEIHVEPRIDLQIPHELGVHPCAGCGKRLQCGGSFDGAIGKHAARGVGSFASGFASFDEQNPCSVLAEFERQR